LPDSHPNQMPPKVALVVDDLGLDPHASKRARELRIPGTRAFLPYADDLMALTNYGLEQGQRHELLVHMPMEPLSKEADPGPRALLSCASREELQRNLEFNLAQFSGYAGISNHMGSKFTSDPQKMLWLMHELKSRNLYFLDSVTTERSAGIWAAETVRVPYIERDVFLDHVDRKRAIRRQLGKALRIARKKGVAVAIGHPRETTLGVLESWLETEDAKRYEFTTLGNVIPNRET